MIAWAYAACLTARIRMSGAAILVAALLLGSLAAEALVGGPVTATGPSTAERLPSTAFHAVVVPPDGASRAADLAPGPGALDPLADTAARGSALRLARPAIAAASVVRFRPRPGQTGIARSAQVSVRFEARMDRASTARAFAVTVNGTPVRGRYRWAEGDTVLVFTPAAAFPYGATVALSVTADARSVNGLRIRAARTVTFTVERKPAARPAVRPAASPTRSASTGWRWPLIGPITQYFGQSLTIYGYHDGIDIDGSTGDPVRAAHAGTVIVAGYYDSCGGLQVHIDHGHGLESWYRHLSKIDVRVGERVSAGTLVGRVGATGCALGSHLHFGIRRNGVFVNPLTYLPRRS